MEYILPERKAFIDYFNDEFYARIIDQRKDKDKTLKPYQELLREYLNDSSPYRGSLVFHGLGTGKTATAITVAEGIGSDWEIITMLPSSLTSNFIEEVKKFGAPIFKLEGSTMKWEFEKWRDMTMESRKFSVEYGLSKSSQEGIARDIDGDKKKAGMWMLSDSASAKKVSDMSVKEKQYLDGQLSVMIRKKYHFFGYSPFLDFKLRMREKTIRKGEKEKYIRGMLKQANEEGTPFNKKVLIIDEVHGFISNVVNKIDKKELDRATLVYSWIMKANNCKLVCLSGTPVVNKPNEMAFLINMLKGIQKIYTFNFSNMSEEEYDTFIKDIKGIVTDKSPIRQYLIEKNRKDQVLLSFIRNPPNFVSIMGRGGVVKTVAGNNDMPEKEFLHFVYDKLYTKYKKIQPSKKEISSLLGKNNDFYKELNTFSLIDDEGNIQDCTKNNTFLDTFFDSSYNIKEDRRDLLLRLCSGCVSYYPSSDAVESEDMAKKNPREEEHSMEEFDNYKTLQNINIVSCPFSIPQFEVYEKERKREAKKKIQMTRNARTMYDMESNTASTSDDDSYSIMSRQICTITSDKKYDVNNILKSPELLKVYSPKFHNLMKIINQKTGRGDKCLIYSEFIQNAGLNNIEVLLTQENIRYKRVTGDEEDKQGNIDEFNANPDILVMLISSAGAQGISLKNIRSVHIIEPYWNFTRLEQVIGRAIRKGSHKDLDARDRNVSIYVYIATFPDIDDKEIWGDMNETEKKKLALQISTLSMKDNFKTMDQYLLSVMEVKHKIVEQCKQILIEASIDCKQNTNEMTNINCLDYPKQLLQEDIYFPGLSFSRMGKINAKQIKIKGTFKGSEYLIRAKSLEGEYDYMLYFNIKKKKTQEITINDLVDPIAVVSLTNPYALIANRTCFNEPPSDFKCLGNVLYLTDDMMEKIDDMNMKYSELVELINPDNLIGYKLVHKNKKEYLATTDLSNDLIDRDNINRLFIYSDFEENGMNIESLQEYSYHNKKIYIV